MENSNQNCQLNFVNKKKTERNNGEEMFSKALVIGGHDGNGSLTATYICKVNDNNKLGASFGRYTTFSYLIISDFKLFVLLQSSWHI